MKVIVKVSIPSKMSKKISLLAYFTSVFRHGITPSALEPIVSVVDDLPCRMSSHNEYYVSAYVPKSHLHPTQHTVTNAATRLEKVGGFIMVRRAFGSVIIGYPLSTISSKSCSKVIHRSKTSRVGVIKFQHT